MAKLWRTVPANREEADRLSRALGVSPLMAQLLLNRDLADPEEARIFLAPDLAQLHPPHLLPQFDRGLERLITALRGGESLLVFGDYDVDGMTAVSLLVRLLHPLTAGKVYYHVPKRLEEGYGLSKEIIAKAARGGVKLMITVDCGIGGREEVAFANELGLDVIVTDHHKPGDNIPDALAVIDPKLPGSAYPYPELAGVGVAFKLVQGLAERGMIDREELHRHLDLVAVGTIADVVPLTGENRVLVHAGLARLNKTGNAGLRALLETARLGDREVTAGHVGFILAPRLNATGRLGDAGAGVRLLLTDDMERGRELAKHLEQENQERQRIEEEVLAEALERIKSGVDLDRERAIVLASPGWHPGVIGIVASRLVEIYHRPVILIALDGEEGRGSGRSIPGFNLHQALAHCAAALVRFGGHEAAAGLTIRQDRLAEFARAFQALARQEVRESMLDSVLHVEAEIDLAGTNLELAREIARLAPHGMGNPAPVLACRGVKVLNCRGVGENGKHLKLRVIQDGAARQGIGFNHGVILREVAAAGLIDLAFSLEENTFNGAAEVQLSLRDVICRPAEEAVVG